MDFDALVFFQEEIWCESALVRIGAASRLRYIASALGPQKTVSELVPYLTKTIQEEPFRDDDEFLYTVAKECMVISDSAYIGGSDEILIAPLEFLASQEETLIREQAIQSLCHIISVHTSLVPEYLVPTLHRLATTTDFFTARVSACGLLPTVYKSAAPEQKSGLRELYTSLCADDAPMVRRAAAQRMGELISVCSKDVVLDDVVQVFKQLSREDSQDATRVSCVHAALMIARLLDDDENMEHTVPFIKEASEDRSWRVRLAVAKNFDQLCSGLGMEIVSAELMEAFAKLMKDSEPEVRKEAVRVIEPCLSLKPPLTSEQLQEHVLPLFEALHFDTAQPVRVVLAQVLGPISRAIGKEDTERLLLPLVSDLLRDDFHDVRLGMAAHLGLLCEVLGVEGLPSSLLSTIQNLFMDSHWRIRQKVIEQVPLLARLLGVDAFQSKLEALYLSSLRDSVHSVRETTTRHMRDIAEAFGPQWTVDKFLPKLLEMYSQNTNYACRVTMLHGFLQVSYVMTPEHIMQFIVPVLIKATKDGVANVRFCACQNIMSMTQHHDFGASGISKVIKPALMELQQDSDSDVQYFTQRAIAVC